MPDEGQPIAYGVLEPDVPVYSSQGDQVGTVDHVVAAPELDIFHGIVMCADGRRGFVAARQVARAQLAGGVSRSPPSSSGSAVSSTSQSALCRAQPQPIP